MPNVLRFLQFRGVSVYTYFGVIFLVALTSFASVYIWSWRIRDVPFMGDETMWITGAMYYTDLAIEGNFEHDDWHAPHLLSMGSRNQPLGKYLLGIGLRLHPQSEASDSEFRELYNYSQPFNWNVARGNVPDADLLQRAREVNTVFVVLCFITLALGAAKCGGVAVGYIVSALTILNGAIQVSLSWALSDAPYNLLLLSGFCAGAFYASAAKRRTQYGLACLCGLLAGAACSVKITGLVVAGIFFVFVGAYRASTSPGTIRKELQSVAMFGACSLAFVYAINPFFWPTSSWTNLFELPNLYWRQKAAFDAKPPETRLWPADTSRFVEMHRVLFIAFSVSPLEWMLFCFGAGFSSYSLVRAVRISKLDIRAIPFLYFLANYLFILTFMEMNWPRHYLSTVFAVKLVTAGGVVFVGRTLLRTIRRFVVDSIRSGAKSAADKPPGSREGPVGPNRLEI